MPEMTEAEAQAMLLRAGIDMPDPTLVARLVAAAGRMRAGIARQPPDLPTGLEPSAAFSVRP
jgi:hypothetical protein